MALVWWAANEWSRTAARRQFAERVEFLKAPYPSGQEPPARKTAKEQLLTAIRSIGRGSDSSEEQVRLLLGVMELSGTDELGLEAEQAPLRLGPNIAPKLVDILAGINLKSERNLLRVVARVMVYLEPGEWLSREAADRVTRPLLDAGNQGLILNDGWFDVMDEFYGRRVIARFGKAALPALYSARQDAWHEERAIGLIEAIDP